MVLTLQKNGLESFVKCMFMLAIIKVLFYFTICIQRHYTFSCTLVVLIVIITVMCNWLYTQAAAEHVVTLVLVCSVHLGKQEQHFSRAFVCHPVNSASYTVQQAGSHCLSFTRL